MNRNEEQWVQAVAHAMALADKHCEGLDGRCRRYRRWAAGGRLVCVTTALAVTLAVSVGIAHASVGRMAAEGALTTDEATECVIQMASHL